MVRIALALALLCAAAPAPAGSAAQGSAPRREGVVTAVLRDGVVRLGATTSVTVTVVGERPARLVAPQPVDGLEWGTIDNPTLAQYSATMGGRSTRTVQRSWAVPLRPTRAGEFQIPPFVVEIDGQLHRSEPLQLLVVEDIEGQTRGFLELVGPTGRIVEGQPFVVEVRFGWDAALSRVNHASLSLPWWGMSPGALQEVLPVARGGNAVVVNGRQEVAVEALDGVRRDGRPYVAFRTRVEFVPTRPGRIELGGNYLEYSEIEADFFTRRRRATSYARGDELTVDVQALPTEGQPFEFGGAVGRFVARASADTRDVRVGESIKFSVEWTGDGNLADFQAPDPRRMQAFDGIRCFGWVEERVPGRRTVTYDIAPMDERIVAIPPLPLVAFDPEAFEYVTIETRPIPIRVSPLPEGALEADLTPRRGKPQVHGIRHGPLEGADAGGDRAPTNDALFAVGGGIALTWLALRTAARRGGVDPGARPERRRRRALSRFSRALAASTDPEGDLHAWTEFVAARLGEEPEAWLGRDIREWSETDPRGRSLSPYVVEELVQTARALEAAAFGGGDRVPRSKLMERARGVLEEGL